MNKYFLIISIVFAGLVSASTQIIKIEVEGYGENLQLAIDRGLTEAMGRINGRSIESEILSKNSEKLSTKNQTEEYLGSSEYQDKIKSRTKGVVDSYDVMSTTKNSGLYKVKLKVSVIKFKTSKTANRKRIAVLDLKYRDRCCRVGNTEINGASFSQELTAAISSYLVQSRKFTVLDRAYESQINKEQARLNSDNVPIKELAKMGQELVADYVLVGTVNALSLKNQTRKLQTVDKTVSSIVGNTGISYRIIDVPTGQVKFSQTLNKNLNGKVESINDPVKGALDSISSIADSLGLKILEAIYPLVIEKIEGNNIIIGTGGDIVSIGERYRLIQYGEKIVDSYTKETLGRKENIIGMVEITEVTSKMSYGRIINTSVENLESKFKPKTFIIRSLPESMNNQDNMKKQKNIRKKIEDEFDENW